MNDAFDPTVDTEPALALGLGLCCGIKSSSPCIEKILFTDVLTDVNDARVGDVNDPLGLKNRPPSSLGPSLGDSLGPPLGLIVALP